jgi:Zn-dependent protease with chaperone function
MSVATQYALNLYLNAACSFMAGVLVVWASVRFFRIGVSRWKLALLALPFVKVLWDLSYRGIPTSSVVYAGIDPLMLPPKSQTLTIGAGLSKFGPIFNLVFSANVPGGRQYSASFADYAYSYLAKHLGAWVPTAILLALLGTSLFLVVRRITAAAVFEARRRARRASDETVSQVRIGWRVVDVYRSIGYEGTPFTGGVVRPYVCIPESTWASLSEPERESVIQHELAHVRGWDLLGTWIVQLLGDVFWFVPGYSLLSRKIDRMRELLADRQAVDSGARADALASALVKLQTVPETLGGVVLYSAFFRERKLISLRVEALAHGGYDRVSRFGWDWLPIRVLAFAWIAGAVMIATFGGNHEVSVGTVDSWLDLLPIGIGSLLRAWGFN